jgi:hypothetical protein
VQKNRRSDALVAPISQQNKAQTSFNKIADKLKESPGLNRHTLSASVEKVKMVKCTQMFSLPSPFNAHLPFFCGFDVSPMHLVNAGPHRLDIRTKINRVQNIMRIRLDSCMGWQLAAQLNPGYLFILICADKPIGQFSERFSVAIQRCAMIGEW